jgi:hypothetical protein
MAFLALKRNRCTSLSLVAAYTELVICIFIRYPHIPSLVAPGTGFINPIACLLGVTFDTVQVSHLCMFEMCVGTLQVHLLYEKLQQTLH